MPPRPSLRSFLASAKTALKQPSSQRTGPLTFVVGNEAADLDSLCSTLVFAYLRSSAPPHTLHIPLSNLPRADLGLRTEMTAVLRRAGLTLGDLLTLSELPPDLDPPDTRWLLVDHNCLTGPLKRFVGQVVGCVDHHADEGVVGEGADVRVIEPCGSCMSLVVDQCRETWDQLAGADVEGGEATAAEEDEKLAMLGLAPILIDTINLEAKDKVRPKDVAAVSFLGDKLQASTGAFDTTQYFRAITAVKEDISTLSSRDILRKDYKQWDDHGLALGISCAVQDLAALVAQADGSSAAAFLGALREWAEERRLDVAAVMTTSHPGGEFRRHLLVWGVTDEGAAAVQRFRRGGEERLQLEAWGEGLLDERERRFAWRQKELTASRKQVAPLLREAMKRD